MTRRTRMLLGSIAATTALILVGAGLAGAEPAERPKKPKDPNATEFAFKGWGFGTKIQGGQVPVASDPTAHQIIGCTNKVGKERTNSVADIALPGLGSVGAVKTDVRTIREGSTVAVETTNSIGKITLSDSPLGTLVLSAVSTTARAFHDGSAFGATTNTDVAKLVFQPASGPPLTLALPAPGAPVEVPGFAKIILAHSWKPTTENGARAFANGLKIRLLATDTVVRVAHAAAVIGSDVQKGIFSGEAYALGGSALANIIKLGKNPLMSVPCQGTDGQVRSRQAVGLDLAGQLVVGGARSEQMTDQTKRRAWGYTKSEVGSIKVGDVLQISGIVGQVNVKRTGPRPRDLARNTDGTTLGTITVNGEAQELPVDQVLEVPGIAKLEPQVVTKLPNGIAVTALRITLLDGTGAVLELGNARLQIRKLPTDKKR